MNTLTSSTVNYSDSGKNIALALMEPGGGGWRVERKGDTFQLLAGEISMYVQTTAGNDH